MPESTIDKAILSGLVIVFLVALWVFRDQTTIAASIISVITAIVGGLLGLMRGSRAQQTNEIQNSTVNQPVVEKS